MADLEEQLSDEEKVGVGGGAVPSRAGPPSLPRLSEAGGRGASSALALRFVFFPSPRGRACQSGVREEGRRGGRGQGWPAAATAPAPAHLPPLLVGSGPGGEAGLDVRWRWRRRRRLLCRLPAAAGAAGMAAVCSRPVCVGRGGR